MNQIALITESTTLYWYSMILALSAAAGVCLFMACCSHAGISSGWASVTALAAVALSLVLSRLIYWYCRPDCYRTLWQALTDPSSGKRALAGAFAGCALAALLLGRLSGGLPRLLDCMSVAGCCAISLGRLGAFFTAADRGRILTEMTWLPWACPVLNATSGELEYRLATFLFQSAAALGLLIALTILFFSPAMRKRLSQGDLTVLFLMVYGASQVILDSTRYDSLYLRSNGFVSMVQILAAVALAVGIVLSSRKAVKARGMKKWMPPAWLTLTALFGCAGYMEYYVQRHGRLAFFSYFIMEHCLVGILVLGIVLWKQGLKQR